MASVFNFTAAGIDGKPIDLAIYRGKVGLIVNVASRCSFTRQYADLEKLYRELEPRGFVILGFPCNQFLWQEPGDGDQIQNFCRRTYNVSFPMFAKVDVNGSKAHPLYRFLKQSAAGWFGVRRIGWNFTKFLFDREGNVVRRYSTMTEPMSLKPDIEKLLDKVEHARAG